MLTLSTSCISVDIESQDRTTAIRRNQCNDRIDAAARSIAGGGDYLNSRASIQFGAARFC